MGIVDIIKMIFPLFLIIILLGGTWYFISKKKVFNNFSKYNNVPIDLVTVKSIMPKRYIAAVKVEDKMLILGITDQSINLLQEKEFDEVYLSDNPNVDVKSKFSEILKNSWPGK